MNALVPLEMLWRTINRARREGYRRGVFRSRSLPRPIISIGNISAGGSGKTPTVIHVARFLVSRGWRVAILSRGFRRSGSDRHIIVEDEDAKRYGDEPVLIRRHVPEGDVVVGADRFEAGCWYLTQHDCDVFLLDDGFQHLQLRRNIDIVIDDPDAAHLREFRSALSEADCLLLRHAPPSPSSGPRAFRLQIEPTALLLGGERHGLGMLVGKKIVAFSGLANNERFFETLESLGGRLVARESFRDHASYDPTVLARLEQLKQEHEADVLVTTEKDWVKFPSFEVGVLIVESVVTPLAEFHEMLIGNLENACRRLGRVAPAFERDHG